MKKNYFLMLFLVFSFFATAQVDWVLNNTNVSNNLNDVWFVNAQKGWIVGDNGIILYTPDAGYHWTEQTSGITTNLNSVCFVNSNQGWAAGMNGKILYTADGGATWNPQTSNTSNELKAVFFTSPTKGWAVGNSGTIRHTSDGGSTWATQSFTVPQNLMAVQFINDSTGWAVGAYGQILFTQNGGTTWSQQTSGTTITLYGVCFTDTIHGWICRQDGKVMKTSNGGTNWSVQNTGTSKYMTSVFFNDSLKGWAAGQDGTTLYTSNGGAAWQIINTGNINTIKSIFFASNKAGWMVGSTGTALKSYEQQKICFVSYDPATGKNQVVWERLWEMGTAFYKIFRLEAGSGFVVFDTVPFHSLSLVTDYTSNPQQNDYYYAISSVDSLGNESPRCPHHRTMLLAVNQGVPSTTINLSWNAYIDSTGGIVPDYYIIYRGSTTDILDSIAAKPAVVGQEYYSWSDLNITSPYYYQVGIRMPYSCTATGESKDMAGPFSQSLSNIEDNGIIDVVINQNKPASYFSIYPNPFAESATIRFYNPANHTYRLTITDISGKIIFEKTGITGSSYDIKRGTLQSGVYFVEINGEQVFRGKLIIE
ncbi:MAG: T9SS type A sorting domain-containing protein [Bacteroidia bacterium]|nr:T9SS type A sorting domain-containing protein [Bacteroidia bacterium]